MDFELSDEHKMFQQAIRQFAEKEVTPLVDEAEERERYPKELFPKLGALGYLCPRYPAEYGGGELGKIGDCILVSELSRICAGISNGIMTQSGSGTSATLLHGTERQKQNYLIPAAKGQKIAAFALTEPNAGSDATAIETNAARKGDHYIVNGVKMFITNAPIADYILTVLYTDKSKGSREGVSLLLIDTSTPGVTINKIHKFCFRASEHGEIVFDNVKVPVDNLLGKEGNGFVYLLELLASVRISHASRTLGIAQAAIEHSIEYSKQRVQFGQPIYKFQAISFKLAEMAVSLEAARLLTFSAAWLHDQGKPHVKEASIAKLFSSEAALKLANEAMQIHGGYAFTSESVIQRIFRDARLGTITDGTSEIQKNTIARQLDLK